MFTYAKSVRRSTGPDFILPRNTISSGRTQRLWSYTERAHRLERANNRGWNPCTNLNDFVLMDIMAMRLELQIMF